MFYSELITPSNFKKMPWKNGLGETTELCCRNDAVTNDVVWRLSIATVIEDGHFSDFSGFQRTLMMISGNGLELSHQGQALQTLRNQYEFCVFDGAWNTNAKLLDGSITDFNVICNSQRASAKVSVIGANETKNLDSYANDIFLFAHKMNGTYRPEHLSEMSDLEIPAGHLLHTYNSETTRMTVSGEALICVEIYNQ